MLCSSCGQKIETGIKFCSGCGTQVSQSGSPQSVNAQNTTVIMSQATGKTFLKVTSILYIVSGIIGVLGSPFSIAYFNSFYLVPGIVKFLLLITVVSSIWHIFVGYFGVKHCNNLKEAKILKTLGIIDIISDIIALPIFSLLLKFSWLSLVGLAIPICYIIGANKNKEALG